MIRVRVALRAPPAPPGSADLLPPAAPAGTPRKASGWGPPKVAANLEVRLCAANGMLGLLHPIALGCGWKLSPRLRETPRSPEGLRRPQLPARLGVLFLTWICVLETVCVPWEE